MVAGVEVVEVDTEEGWGEGAEENETGLLVCSFC